MNSSMLEVVQNREGLTRKNISSKMLEVLYFYISL